MAMARAGLAVAGNLLVDTIYPVERYPAPGELTTVGEGITRSTGGAVCNVAVDLRRIDPALPVTALGVVGDDEPGAYIKDTLAREGVDIRHLATGGATSFTAVMVDGASKQRTFFQYRGANALFCEKHVPLDVLTARILHVGYLLLLDALDAPDREYGTRLARLLSRAREQGMETSVDAVSAAGGRFREIVPPALRYTDYCIINEVEAEKITSIPLRGEDGRLRGEGLPEALGALKGMGVSRWAVIHMPEGGCGLDCRSGEYRFVPSLSLPAGWIQGTNGAGDAFCAGVLYEAQRGGGLSAALRFGNGCAACSLCAPGATGGMRGEAEIKKLCAQLEKGEG